MSTVSIFSETRAFLLLVFAIALSATACSGADNSGPALGPPCSLTLMITSAGVGPKTLAVGPGSQVTFVNNDVVAHEMHSDPHPDHTDCPELNQVGFLSPGQSRQTGNLNTIRTCGFHDHAQPLNMSLQGSILIR